MSDRSSFTYRWWLQCGHKSYIGIAIKVWQFSRLGNHGVTNCVHFAIILIASFRVWNFIHGMFPVRHITSIISISHISSYQYILEWYSKICWSELLTQWPWNSHIQSQQLCLVQSSLAAGTPFVTQFCCTEEEKIYDYHKDRSGIRIT